MNIRDFFISHEDSELIYCGRKLMRNNAGYYFVYSLDGGELYCGENEDKAVNALQYGRKQ